MLLLEFDKWCRSFLEIDELSSLDLSLNGLQVGDKNQEIHKIAFAVDACQDTINKAIDEKADLLFVHHGLFWGKPLALVGSHYKRVKALIENNVSLYAVHLPLDKNNQYGNNKGLAKALGLDSLKPFGLYRGTAIGLQGEFSQPIARNQIVPKLFGSWDSSILELPFGPSQIKTVGIISGGGTSEVSQAIDAGLDLYITGDRSHQIYHQAKEEGINVLFGGHYLTETVGPRLLMEKVELDLGLETCFIDVPTGL